MNSLKNSSETPKNYDLDSSYLDKAADNPDFVQKIFSVVQQLAKIPSRLGLPYFMPELVESVLTMPKGRSAHRFRLQWHYFTWRKLFNFLLIEAQLILGIARVKGYPYEWEIDTTNICQLKCPLCHTGLGNISRVKGTMHFDTFRKTIDEIKNHTIWLSLYSWGEPLLNKQLVKFLRYAHESRIATVISTNLSLKLTPKKVEDLVTSGLDIIIVSLDGVTQDVYEKYRVRGNLDLVLENIKMIVDKKRELRSEGPYIEWQFIVMKQNEHQIPAARKMALDLGVDQIIFKKVDFPHGIGSNEMVDQWQPVKTKAFQRESPLDKPYNEKGPKCWKLWRSSVINWDGGYATCCYLTDFQEDFGNVNENSIAEIWNNEKYITARKLFLKNELPQVQVGCINCDVFLESPKGKRNANSILRRFPNLNADNGPPDPIITPKRSINS